MGNLNSIKVGQYVLVVKNFSSKGGDCCIGRRYKVVRVDVSDNWVIIDVPEFGGESSWHIDELQSWTISDIKRTITDETNE